MTDFALICWAIVTVGLLTGCGRGPAQLHAGQPKQTGCGQGTGGLQAGQGGGPLYLWPARGPLANDPGVGVAAAKAWEQAKPHRARPDARTRLLWAGDVATINGQTCAIALVEANTHDGPAVATVETYRRHARLLTIALIPANPPPVLAVRGNIDTDCKDCVYAADTSEGPLVVIADPDARTLTYSGAVGLAGIHTSATVAFVHGVATVSTNASLPTQLTIPLSDGQTLTASSGCYIPASQQDGTGYPPSSPSTSPIPRQGTCPS